MTDQPNQPLMAAAASGAQHRGGRFLGSLKDALAAASRDDTVGTEAAKAATPPPIPALPAPNASATSETAVVVAKETQTSLTAREAARAARGTTKPMEERHVEAHEPPTTRVVRAKDKSQEGPARTQLVRGKASVKRGTFESDPVVGWLVVVGGPGIGQYRAIFEGNNSLGRATSNRIAVDFGDDAISSEEQAYIRYDSGERSFLFVPNLAKTNVVSVNDKRPTAAVALSAMDVITVGRTQLVFVPFCGTEFDWSALGDK